MRLNGASPRFARPPQNDHLSCFKRTLSLRSSNDLIGAPPTACRHPVSGSLSPPLSGYFSPFPHGTGSLSVAWEYLGLEGGPPMFRQDFTCPALLKDLSSLSRTGLSPTMGRLPRRFRYTQTSHWPGPLSLATTRGVSVDVLSSGYLDVSVRRVRLITLCIQIIITLMVYLCIRNSSMHTILSPQQNLLFADVQAPLRLCGRDKRSLAVIKDHGSSGQQ